MAADWFKVTVSARVSGQPERTDPLFIMAQGVLGPFVFGGVVRVDEPAGSTIKRAPTCALDCGAG
jgi:hypothetical protein